MRWRAIAAFVIPAVLVPFVGDNYIIRVATFMMMYVVLALSWNFIGGLSGYPSFATAAFFGLGAYAGAVAQVNGTWMYLSWSIGGLFATSFVLLLGLAILRLKGHYFAIASLVTAELLREIVNSSVDITGGGMGLNLPVLGMSVDAQARFFYYSMFVVAFLTLSVSSYVRSMHLGFGLSCIKQNEHAANMIGINTTLYKTTAFVFSAVFVGCSGGINASWVNYIEPEDVFDVLLSVKAIVMVLIGGAGSLFGPLIGAIAFLLLEEIVWRNLLTFHTGALGVLVVCLILFLPNGLSSLGMPRSIGRKIAK